MDRTRAFYSVVQHVPDGARAEGANAGVAVFIPETGAIEVQLTPTLARIKKFFTPSKKELRRIELALEGLHYRLTTAKGEFRFEAEFAQFVAARADAVRLTPPKLVVLTDLESELQELYAELVGDEAPTSAREKAASFPSRVAEVFGRLEAMGRVWRPGRIIVPETKRRLAIPLAYRNGRVNYVLPQSLAPANRPDERLTKLGFHGLLIHNHAIDSEEGKLVVLSVDAKADHETEGRYAEVLDDFHVRFVPYEQTEAFAAEVEITAH